MPGKWECFLKDFPTFLYFLVIIRFSELYKASIIDANKVRLNKLKYHDTFINKALFAQGPPGTPAGTVSALIGLFHRVRSPPGTCLT